MNIAPIMLSLIVATSAGAKDARTLVLEGNAQYEQGEYERAAKLYEQAAEAENAPLETIYNRACALYRQGELDQAERLFRSVESSPEAGELASKAAHNIGRLILDRALADEPQTDELEDLIETLRSAESSFRNAINLNPRDADAARNLELTRWNIRAIEKMIEQAKQQQDAADALDELADQQQQQSEQNQQGSQGQQQAQQQQQSLDEQTRDASQDAEQLGQQAMSNQHKEQTSSASESLREAQDAQQRANEAMERGDMQEAARQQQQAADHLRDAAESLRPPEVPGEQEPQEASDQDGEQGEPSDEQQPGEQSEQQGESQGEQQGEPTEAQAAQEATDGELPEQDELAKLIEQLLEKEERVREARRQAMQRAPGTKPVEKDW